MRSNILKIIYIRVIKLTSMQRKTFIQWGSVLTMGSLILSSVACKLTKTKNAIKNWAGNITFSTDKVYAPSNVNEIISIVKK